MNYAERILAVLNQTIASRIKRRETKGFLLKAQRKVVCGVEIAITCPLGQSYETVRRHLHKVEAYCGHEVELEDYKRTLVVRVIEKDWPMPMRYDPAHLRQDSLLIGYNRQLEPVYHPLNVSMLVGGASGAGKTDWLRWIILQLYLQDYDIRMVDMKKVSFFPFEDNISGFQVAKNMPDAHSVIKQTFEEYEERSELIERTRDRDACKDLKPIVLIIDEAASIAPTKVSPEYKEIAKEADHYIGELGRLGREFRVLVIYCTQRPDKDSINAQFKANVDAVICFRTKNDANSMIILGYPGAELIDPKAKGRFIYSYGTDQTLQGPYVGGDKEWAELLEPLKNNVEVINNGFSTRRPDPARTYYDVPNESADRDDGADRGSVSQQRGSVQNGIPVSQSTGIRSSGNLRLAPPLQGVAAHASRPQANECYTDEI